MKRVLLCVAVLGLLSIATVTMAAGNGIRDGLSWNPGTGATGHFNGTLGGGAYPHTLASPVAAGWTNEQTPEKTYISYKGAWSFNGIYDYDDYVWFGGTGDEDAGLKVIADVEMWCSETLSATEVYFHLGNENAHAMNAYISGTLQSNNGQWVGLTNEKWGSGDKADADKLAFLEDGFGRTKAWFQANQPSNVPTDIPLAYAFSSDGGATWGTPGWSGGNNNQDWGYWSPGALPAGASSFWWRLTINPKPYQEDGRYYLDPSFTTMPEL